MSFVRVKRFMTNRSRLYCFGHNAYRAIFEPLSKKCRHSFCTEITYSRFPLVGHFLRARDFEIFCASPLHFLFHRLVAGLFTRCHHGLSPVDYDPLRKELLRIVLQPY